MPGWLLINFIKYSTYVYVIWYAVRMLCTHIVNHSHNLWSGGLPFVMGVDFCGLAGFFCYSKALLLYLQQKRTAFNWNKYFWTRSLQWCLTHEKISFRDARVLTYTIVITKYMALLCNDQPWFASPLAQSLCSKGIKHWFMTSNEFWIPYWLRFKSYLIIIFSLAVFRSLALPIWEPGV